MNLTARILKLNLEYVHKSWIMKNFPISIAKRYCFNRSILESRSLALQIKCHECVALRNLSIIRKYSNAIFEHFPKTETKAGTSALGKIEPKLFLAFTCKICNARIEKHISKVAYKKGVVIVTCDGCDENHLIADNLGWFPDIKSRNIEDIMAEKGETVRKKLDDITVKEV